MHPFPMAGPFDVFAATLAVAFAVLAVGGSVLLRWQRARQQFELTKAALDRGIDRLPSGPPLWLISLRQGVTTAALGAGLILVGAVAWSMGHGAAMPSVTTANGAAAADTRPSMSDGGPPPPPPFDFGPPGRGGPDGPDGGPPDGERGPGFGGRPGFGRGGRPGFGPPPGGGNPQMDLWHRAQLQVELGQLAVAAGVVLFLVGAARIGLSRTERRVLTERQPPPDLS